MNVFVMMPFAPAFAEVRNAIRHAADRSNVYAVLVDETARTGMIDERLRNEIRQSSACIVDITGRNPNVIWEMGFAQALGKPIVMLAQDLSDLFIDTHNVMTIKYDTNEIERSLIQPLTLALSSPELKRGIVAPASLAGTPALPESSVALCLNGIGGTPYDFASLLRNAKERVLIAAQHHSYIVEHGADLTPKIFEFLNGGARRRFDVLICDPEATYAVDTWVYVTSDRYRQELPRAIDFFERMVGEAEVLGLGSRFRVTKAAFVPTTATFVDPAADSGLAVVVPNVFHAVSNWRPHFVLSKSHNKDIFKNLWSVYEQRIAF